MICLNSAGGLARSEVEIGGDDEHLRAMRRAADARRHTRLPNPKRFRAAGCTLHRAVHVTNERRDAFIPRPKVGGEKRTCRGAFQPSIPSSPGAVRRGTAMKNPALSRGDGNPFDWYVLPTLRRTWHGPRRPEPPCAFEMSMIREFCNSH